MTTKIVIKISRVVLTLIALFFFGATITIASPTLGANGKIVFTSDRDGNLEIYVMNADGTDQIRLTNNSIVDDHAMWSPDGTKLAFVSQSAVGGFAIFQMNTDGSNRAEITSLSDFVSIEPSGSIGFSMSWSPDGRKIAFQDPYYDDIWVVDVETHARQNLTNNGGGTLFSLSDYHPSWSPDGTKILYSSPRLNGLCPSLYEINPDGTDQRLLSEYCSAYSPNWSPDGTKIVFVRLWGESVETQLILVNSDGTFIQVFDGADLDPNNRDYPRWSPDGQKIAFNMTKGSDIEIHVKNVDGTGSVQLTNSPSGRNYRPSWQPLAAAVSVSGRVMTPYGRGLRNAVVSLSLQGIRRIVTTSSFGFYSFDNVATGQTYTMRVSSKLYRFSSRVVSVDAGLTGVDFVGVE
jgi:TolB protein